MRRSMVFVLIFALLSFWIPCASAEISQELDPMVSPDAQATVISTENPVNSIAAEQTSSAVAPAEVVKEEKKVEGTKKVKSKKSSTKKSSEKKKKKSSSKSSKKHKKSAN